MLHVYMLDCAARLVTAQDVATSAFALRIKGFLLPAAAVDTFTFG